MMFLIGYYHQLTNMINCILQSYCRYLHRLKCYVCNKAHPEGCIAEAYIAEECMIFCARYLQGVETKENRATRNCGMDAVKRDGLPIFSSFGYIIGHQEIDYLDYDTFSQVHQYVLFNCEEVAQYAQ